MADLTYKITGANTAHVRSSNEGLSPDDRASFNDRFGSRISSEGIIPRNPNQFAPPPLDDAQEQADLRALDARLSSSGDIRDAMALYNARKSSRR